MTVFTGERLIQDGFLGPPVVPFHPFLGEGSPTKIDYRKSTLILTSLLEDLVLLPHRVSGIGFPFIGRRMVCPGLLMAT